MRRVFFYGLFMNEALLQDLGLHPTNPMVAHLDGYGLRIGERATLVRSEGERAYGVVMTLSAEELNALYSGEGLSEYVPEDVVAIDSSNDRHPVVAYNLPADQLAGRNAEYARSLSEVARRYNLPDEYVEEIERLGV